MIKIKHIKNKVKALLGELWWYSIVLFFTQRIGDLVNIYIGIWLVPKFVPMEQLGALLPLTQLAGFIGLPLAIILTPFTKFIGTFSVQGEHGKVKLMLRDVAIILVGSSFIIGFLTWRSATFFFRAPSRRFPTPYLDSYRHNNYNPYDLCYERSVVGA